MIVFLKWFEINDQLEEVIQVFGISYYGIMEESCKKMRLPGSLAKRTKTRGRLAPQF